MANDESNSNHVPRTSLRDSSSDSPSWDARDPRTLRELRDAIESVATENADLRDQIRDQSAVVARLVDQLETLERLGREIGDGVGQLPVVEERILAEIGANAARLDRLSSEVATLGARRTRGASAFRREGESIALRVGRSAGGLLPDFVRVPLRHGFYRIVYRLSPTNERARAYHEFRRASLSQAAALKNQQELFRKILDARSEDQLDVIVLPIIDWHFRIQRPQHMARGLAAAGHRVFYLSTTFEPHATQPGFNVLESPHENVFVCQLYCPEPHPSIYECRRDASMADHLARGLDVMFQNFRMDHRIALIQHPYWLQVVERLRGTLSAYDCMDHHAGFTTSNPDLATEEDHLLRRADVTITTSTRLAESVGKFTENVLIRNAADVEHFAVAPRKLAVESANPVIGYFGAISSWFDIDLVAEMAARFGDWTFVLVGSTYECDTRRAAQHPNVLFTGEVPYEELPAYLHAFDVCMIPFKLNELTACTNPVKVYEYLSAGKPVVATPMPEVVRLSEFVHIAGTPSEFADALQLAVAESGREDLREVRSDWASTQTWDVRAARLESAIQAAQPKVSVIVLAHNQLEITKACLHSLEQHSNYPNLELVLVDNGSSDGVREFFESYSRTRPAPRVPEVKAILNDRNLGFAGGNNRGIEAATGDIIILLNNDTYVTEGWAFDLIRHLLQTPRLGLVGPVTNNIGNEAKIPIEYASMTEMAEQARRHTSEHSRELLFVDKLAFFCVAMTREVVDRVGLLDEEFDIGFFEDDDYCNRARQAGYRAAIAEDVFVHHHLSASFGLLKPERRQALFDQNRRHYERKWGPWKAHQYREGV